MNAKDRKWLLTILAEMQTINDKVDGEPIFKLGWAAAVRTLQTIIATMEIS
jgi:hypothetical protein